MLLGLALTLPSLAGGLAVDDYIHRIGVLGHPRIPSTPFSPFDLFHFTAGDPESQHELMDRLMGLWGIHEDLKIAFMRPLSSLTHWIDYRGWPEQAWLMHLQNLLWYGILIYLVARFYRRVLGPTWVAGLAMLAYAIDDAHGMTVGWIANRNALIAGVFGMLSLLIHLRWRREHWRPGAWLGPTCFAVALTAGESAIGAGAYLLAYAVFLDRSGWRNKCFGLAPYGMVVFLWRIVYSTLGFGVRGTDLYVDPLGEPLIFLAAAAGRLPVYLLGQFGFPPADLWLVVSDPGRRMLTVSGVLAVGMMIALIVPLLRRSAEARFMGLGALAAVIPMCATYPFDRHLIFVGVGAMGLVASFIGFVAEAANESVPRGWLFPAQVLAGVWLLIHVIVAPLALPIRVLDPQRMDAFIERAARSLPADETLASQHLVVVNAPEIMSSIYAILRRASRGDVLPDYVRFLSISDNEIRVERQDAVTLKLQWSEGLFVRPLDRFFRGLRHPFKVGDTFDLTGFRARVMRLTHEGRPAAVEYRFSVPLEDPILRWVVWEGKGYQPFELPALGETRVLPPVDLIELLAN